MFPVSCARNIQFIVALRNVNCNRSHTIPANSQNNTRKSTGHTYIWQIVKLNTTSTNVFACFHVTKILWRWLYLPSLHEFQDCFSVSMKMHKYVHRALHVSTYHWHFPMHWWRPLNNCHISDWSVRTYVDFCGLALSVQLNSGSISDTCTHVPLMYSQTQGVELEII